MALPYPGHRRRVPGFHQGARHAACTEAAPSWRPCLAWPAAACAAPLVTAGASFCRAHTCLWAPTWPVPRPPRHPPPYRADRLCVPGADFSVWALLAACVANVFAAFRSNENKKLMDTAGLAARSHTHAYARASPHRCSHHPRHGTHRAPLPTRSAPHAAAAPPPNLRLTPRRRRAAARSASARWATSSR